MVFLDRKDRLNDLGEVVLILEQALLDLKNRQQVEKMEKSKMGFVHLER